MSRLIYYGLISADAVIESDYLWFKSQLKLARQKKPKYQRFFYQQIKKKTNKHIRNKYQKKSPVDNSKIT